MMLSMSIGVLYFFKIKPLNYYDSVVFTVMAQYEVNKSSKKDLFHLTYTVYDDILTL